MGFLYKVLAFIAVATAGILFVYGIYTTTFKPYSISASAALSVAPGIQAIKAVATTTPINLSVLASDNGYTELDGMIIVDNRGGEPVPYLQYVTSANEVRTKQLIFPNSRGCSTYAGDLPCVDINQQDAYPKVTQGQQVHIKGKIVADRLLVYTISNL
jgi:hypothetical protein